MVVYQIILGKVPWYLKACISSVKAFTGRVGCEYRVITEIPCHLSVVPFAIDEYYRYRIIKDWITLELLSKTSQTFVCDWDIDLDNTFTFNANSKYPIMSRSPIDCMVYNGQDTVSFNRIKQLAGDPAAIKPGILLTANAIRLYRDENPKFKFLEFDYETYKHLDNCRLR